MCTLSVTTLLAPTQLTFPHSIAFSQGQWIPKVFDDLHHITMAMWLCVSDPEFCIYKYI